MIVWDLGGVVARFDPGARLAALAAATGLPAPAIDAAIWGSGLDAAAERGSLAEAEVWDSTLAALDHRVDVATVRRCWAVAFVADPVVLGRVERPAALFTDNGPILGACLEHELRPIAERFDRVLLSCQLGATKQDPLAYERAAALLARAPGELTLRDDRLDNVAAALEAGWHAELVPPSTGS